MLCVCVYFVIVFWEGGRGRRRHNRQLSRNLGSLAWGGGGAGRKKKAQSASFPQPRVFSLGGGGGGGGGPFSFGVHTKGVMQPHAS